MTQVSDPNIRIAQIFLSSVSFAHREDALRLPPNTGLGEMEVQINVEIEIAHGGDHGVIRLRAETRPDANDLYRLRVEMTAMVMHADGAEGMTVNDYLMKSGSFMVYPFLREAVANLTARGRFGPIWLRPINFKALAEQMNARAITVPVAPQA